MRGMKQSQPGLPSKPILPITPVILRKIRVEWGHIYDYAVGSDVLICFFGFLHACRQGSGTQGEL